MRLDSKVALITGGAQGIGRACAEAFVAEGARIVLADINEDAGTRAAAELGEGVRFVACDVGDHTAVERTIAAAVSSFGGLDVLVNNAALIHGAGFLDLTEADFDRVLRVNLKGAFLMAQAAARQMVAQGRGGAIVNMSSINAVMAIATQVPYSIAKGGLNQLTKVAALALAPHGIRVNGIGPGSIATDMLKTVMADPAAQARVLSRTPLGRLGEPAEIARIAVFLASDEASYITGQTVYADGGRLALNYTVP